MKTILLALFGMALSFHLQAQNTTATNPPAGQNSPAKQAAMNHPERHPLTDAQKAQLKDQEEGPQSKSPGNSKAKRPRSFAPSTQRKAPQTAAGTAE